jgi:protease YdgD
MTALTGGRGRGVLLALLLAAGAAGAEGPGGEVPAAIGRISYGPMVLPGAAICTGTLVAPDLVLTAGHCLGAGDPGAVRFAVGFRDGGARALRRGREVLRAEGPPLPGAAGLAGDLALLRLDRPVPAAVAEPLALAEVVPETPPGMATTAGYRRDAPQAAPEPWLCAIRLREGGILGLGCPAVSGNSGAPLMQRGEAGWRVVAVMVAAVPEGRVRSVAAVPGPGVRAMVGDG